MSNRILIIGLRPEYCYPGRMSAWSKSDTLYAANHGACLITRALLRQFNGTYVDDFTDIDRLRDEFDAVVLAFATHIHPSRDISAFTSVVERLQLPTYFLSGGITDYAQDTTLDYTIHPSVIRLLEIVSASSRWIGVRGHYTANVLRRAGFRNVMPIGCPTLFWNLDGPIRIQKQLAPKSVVVPYHLTLAKEIPDWLPGKVLLGQDFQDQAIFSNELSADSELQTWLRGQFPDDDAFEDMNKTVQDRGVWHNTFSEWFEFLGQHDFVVGPRLHGCVSGLIQKIPTLMTYRDLRGREIAEFFDIPSMTYGEVSGKSDQELYDRLDFSRFSETHERRLNNYLQFLRENGLKSEHTCEAQTGYSFAPDDLISQHSIAQGLIGQLGRRVEDLEERCRKNESNVVQLMSFRNRLRYSLFGKVFRRVANHKNP